MVGGTGRLAPRRRAGARPRASSRSPSRSSTGGAATSRRSTPRPTRGRSLPRVLRLAVAARPARAARRRAAGRSRAPGRRRPGAGLGTGWPSSWREPVDDDVLTVVWHSVTRMYWPVEETAAMDAAVEEARSRMPLAHVAMEHRWDARSGRRRGPGPAAPRARRRGPRDVRPPRPAGDVPLLTRVAGASPPAPYSGPVMPARDRRRSAAGRRRSRSRSGACLGGLRARSPTERARHPGHCGHPPRPASPSATASASSHRASPTPTPTRQRGVDGRHGTLVEAPRLTERLERLPRRPPRPTWAWSSSTCGAAESFRYEARGGLLLQHDQGARPHHAPAPAAGGRRRSSSTPPAAPRRADDHPQRQRGHRVPARPGGARRGHVGSATWSG